MFEPSEATKVPPRLHDDLEGDEGTTSAEEGGTVQGREWTTV